MKQSSDTQSWDQHASINSFLWLVHCQMMQFFASGRHFQRLAAHLVCACFLSVCGLPGIERTTCVQLSVVLLYFSIFGVVNLCLELAEMFTWHVIEGVPIYCVLLLSALFHYSFEVNNFKDLFMKQRMKKFCRFFFGSLRTNFRHLCIKHLWQTFQ